MVAVVVIVVGLAVVVVFVVGLAVVVVVVVVVVGLAVVGLVVDVEVVGCLLYTSPSPRDGLLSRMPSSA